MLIKHVISPQTSTLKGIMEKKIAIVASPSMLNIAKEVHFCLENSKTLLRADFNYEFVPVEIKNFPNREFVTNITENVREKRVVYFGPSFIDPVPALMETMMTINALHLASSSEIHLLLPFIGFMRQDRKDKPRVPITGKMVADMLSMNNYVRTFTTIDLHVEQEVGFFQIPINNLPGRVIHAEYLRQRFGEDCKNLQIIAPDINGAKQAMQLAELLECERPIGIFQKSRDKNDGAPKLRYTGQDPSGFHSIICDDMCDTGGTILEAGKRLQDMGAKSTTACFSHAILSSKNGLTAEEKFADSGISLVSTDSIPRSEEYQQKNKSWLTMLSIVPYLSHALYETHMGGSISSLFTKSNLEDLP